MSGFEARMRTLAESEQAAEAFPLICRDILAGRGRLEPTLRALRAHGIGHASLFAEKAAAAISTDAVWADWLGREISAGWLASIADGSILETLARYAVTLPRERFSVIAASGFVADVIAEGVPKVVKVAGLDALAAEGKKTAAIVIWSNELATATGNEIRRLFERELRNAILRATNQASLDQLLDSTTTMAVAGTGTAKGDLAAGLAASAPSDGYVVVAAAGVVAELSLASEGRMAVNGGEFLPGLHVVAHERTDASAGPTLTIIPASRCGIRDEGLAVSFSDQASVAMSDTPSSPAQQVSLFQTNCAGLVAHRMFRTACASEIVEVG